MTVVAPEFLVGRAYVVALGDTDLPVIPAAFLAPLDFVAPTVAALLLFLAVVDPVVLPEVVAGFDLPFTLLAPAFLVLTPVSALLVMTSVPFA